LHIFFLHAWPAGEAEVIVAER